MRTHPSHPLPTGLKRSAIQAIRSVPCTQVSLESTPVSLRYINYTFFHYTPVSCSLLFMHGAVFNQFNSKLCIKQILEKNRACTGGGPKTKFL